MGPLYTLFLVHDLQQVMASRKATLLETTLGCIWMSDTSYKTNRIKKFWGKRGVFTWANPFRGTPSPGRAGLEKSPWKQTCLLTCPCAAWDKCRMFVGPESAGVWIPVWV